MVANWRSWWGNAKRPRYSRRPPLVLINGLAEQAESWFCNVQAWRQHFEVYLPNLLAYEGECLQARIDQGLPVDVDFLVQQLRSYLGSFVQSPPYHLVANSLGGKVAVEFAVRYPDQVAKLVLLCPSGLTDHEHLPLVEGVRRSDLGSVIQSVFHDARCADSRLLDYYQGRFASRRWRSGLLRTVRGTMDHRVRHLLTEVRAPSLLVVGRQDRIVDPATIIAAAPLLPHGKLVILENCGHAPQIEKAKRVNRLVVDFLQEDAAPSGQVALQLRDQVCVQEV